MGGDLRNRVYEHLNAHGKISGTVQGSAPVETFVLTYTGTAATD